MTKPQDADEVLAMVLELYRNNRTLFSSLEDANAQIKQLVAVCEAQKAEIEKLRDPELPLDTSHAHANGVLQ